MASLITTVGRWFGWGGALGENTGQQITTPSGQLIEGTRVISSDGAMQISAVWACVDRRASTIASLPFFAYQQVNGQKVLARTTRLYSLLHESPNSRMTPLEFWRCMVMSHDLRGNAYARIDRDASGEAYALWPMSADQIRPVLLDDGAMVYEYMVNGVVAYLAEDNVLHLKNLGNGTVGLSKLDYMAGTTNEMANAQGSASRIFGNSGKPTGVLMVDSALTPLQRESIRANYGDLVAGSTQRLAVLEANMKFQQLSLSPQDQQLLETRSYGIEEICRWFDVPPVLVHHANVTTWGSGIEQIMDGWYKLSVRPMLVSIEQAVRKRVMTPRQRATMSCEFSLDALLRGNPVQRAEMFAKSVQNGWLTRAEVRQLEGWPQMDGTDVLTAQSNLLPLDKLGTVVASGGKGADIAQ